MGEHTDILGWTLHRLRFYHGPSLQGLGLLMRRNLAATLQKHGIL